MSTGRSRAPTVASQGARRSPCPCVAKLCEALVAKACDGNMKACRLLADLHDLDANDPTTQDRCRRAGAISLSRRPCGAPCIWTARPWPPADYWGKSLAALVPNCYGEAAW